MKKIVIEQYGREDILQIRLLSADEYEKCMDFVPKSDSWWWLLPHDELKDDDLVVFVGANNKVCYFGSVVDDADGGIRPVFIIGNLCTAIGEKIVVGNILCTVIGDNTALSDMIVDRDWFDRKSSNWETSSLKDFIESDDFLYLIGLQERKQQ